MKTNQFRPREPKQSTDVLISEKEMAAYRYTGLKLAYQARQIDKQIGEQREDKMPVLYVAAVIFSMLVYLVHSI